MRMRTCQYCGRVRFYSLNFLFSKTICNECYLKLKERHDDNGYNNNNSIDDSNK